MARLSNSAKYQRQRAIIRRNAELDKLCSRLRRVADAVLGKNELKVGPSTIAALLQETAAFLGSRKIRH
jgi:hypothetical protein